MENKVTIVGAGLAGLIAGVMLRDDVSKIIEAQGKLPNNHTAVMRFRSKSVSDAVNIPFRRVKTAWSVDQDHYNDLYKAMRYSFRCTTKYDPTRSISRHLKNLSIDYRYICPPNFPTLLFDKLMCEDIRYREYFDTSYIGMGPVISTIPMWKLIDILNYKNLKKEDFHYMHGITCSIKIPDMDCFATLYTPLDICFQRLSITGDKIVGESSMAVPDEKIVGHFLWLCEHKLGIEQEVLKDIKIKTDRSEYAKIVEINDDARKRFILWATERYNIYSLGRFATWRPGLLLDDVVDDVRHISKLINGDAQGFIYSYLGKD